ncbi:MAG: protein kinase [Planctomycetota bacterium]
MSSFRLVVEKGPQKGSFLRLKANGQVVVGREAQNDLAIKDPQASRKHFRIEAKLGEYRLQDLQSSNGTFVNGERQQNAVLRPGDRIAAGGTLLFFLRETDEEKGHRRGPLTGKEVGGYRVGRVLGRGGMGTVYEAVQISLERTVALKVLSPELQQDPEFIERFIGEARAAGRLNHANIVSVFDVGRVDDLQFFSMEYMAGGSLDDLRRREGTVPVADTIPLMFDAARGLEYAEKQGLVHRDIKPDNLMLSGDGVLKICDLGLAIFTARQQEVSGSPHYIAPEQALGQELDHRADLYALGVTWYELLCGQTPYSGSSAAEIARKHVEEQAPPLAERAPGLLPEVVALVEGLMQKDPAQRLGSARQLQADLAELARRLELAETIRLRIDAVAPNVPVSEALRAALPATPLAGFGLPGLGAGVGPGARKALWAAGGLALILGVSGAAYWGARELSARRAARLAERTAQVEEVEALVARDPALAEGRARDLSEELRAIYPELAERAAAVVGKVEEQRAAGKRREREEAAARRLQSARSLFQQQGVAAPGDPEVMARLREILRIVSGLIEGYGDTPAAVEAQELRDQVLKALDKAQEAAAERQRREAAARRALKTTEARVKELLAREGKGCWADARAAVKDYMEAHGAVEPRAGQALLELVRNAARRAVTSAVSLSRTHLARRAWSEAAAALDVVGGPLGFEDLEGDVAQALAEIGETRRAHERAEEERVQREAETALGRARADLAGCLQERRFDDAASRLRGALTSLELMRAPAVKRLGELRVTRLEGADRALEQLIAHVKAGKQPAPTLELELPGGELRRARAVKYEALQRAFVFQFTAQILRDVRVNDLTPEQLLELCGPLGDEPRQLLDRACLAYELGAGPQADALARRASGLSPKLAREAEDLRVLDGAR